MRTTVDIPEPLYLQLKKRAEQENTSVEALILKGVTVTLREEARPPRAFRSLRLPILHSKAPGSLKLGPEGVYEYIPFP